MMSYWVGGSFFGGVNDQYDLFIRRGYKTIMFSHFLKVEFSKSRKVIDWLSKGCLDKGHLRYRFRALGIVTDVDLTEWRVYVRWLLTGMDRQVPFNGCGGSIHGPYQYDDDWTRRVFRI